MSKMDDLEKRMIDKPEKANVDHTLLNFFLGLILFALGIFLVCRNTYVTTSWHIWHVGNIGIPTGVVAVPLLIGIGVLFFNSKSIIGWIVVVLGLVFLLASIILSVQIRFSTTSLFQYILMFGCIFAGAGLLLRSLFKKEK